MTSSTSRPLVVLAGWLGCQPKYLRRYEEIYRKNGFQVISRVANPPLIMRNIFEPLPPVLIPARWSTPGTAPASSQNPANLQDHAWNILHQIHHRSQDTSFLIFHAFSNGGCFVWDHVRRILGAAESNDLPHSGHNDQEHHHHHHENVKEDLLQIQRKLKGVVFDSCPGADMSQLYAALAYCTWPERLDVLLHCGTDFLFWFRPQVKEKLALRGQMYMDGIRNDPWDIQQLYLYSQNDALAPATDIDMLVSHRQQLVGPHRISSQRWATSIHCAHLLKHPEEYEVALTRLIDACRFDAAVAKL